MKLDLVTRLLAEADAFESEASKADANPFEREMNDQTAELLKEAALALRSPSPPEGIGEAVAWREQCDDWEDQSMWSAPQVIRDDGWMPALDPGWTRQMLYAAPVPSLAAVLRKRALSDDEKKNAVVDVIEEMLGLFDEAIADGDDKIILHSAVGARFHQRMQEAYRRVSDTTAAPVPSPAIAEARKQAFEDVLALIGKGYPRPVGVTYRKDGVSSRHDKCAHGVVMYEDCEACLTDAIRRTAQGGA